MTDILIKYISSKYKDRQRSALSALSGIFGIVCNIFICILKFAVGSISSSVSITADAVNNLSDAGSGIVTIAGAKLSAKPVDREHPLGHGRAEYISALAVAFFIFVMSFELAKGSFEKIINPDKVTFRPWHLLILAFTILIKLYMAYFNNKLYKTTGNINLKAVRQDSINDCIASSATIIALVLSSLTPLKRADGIIGAAVAVFIFISGIKIVRDINNKLLGQAPSPKLVKSIEQIILEDDIIIGVHDLIIHEYGPDKIIASAHAEVPSNADIVTVHNAIDKAERKISQELNTVICIHMDPISLDDEVEKYKAFTSELLSRLDSDYQFHDFRVVKKEKNVSLIFDLVVPFDRDTAEVLNEVKEKFADADNSINLIITVEHPFV